LPNDHAPYQKPNQSGSSGSTTEHTYTAHTSQTPNS
jgi:hypothetical protein